MKQKLKYLRQMRRVVAEDEKRLSRDKRKLSSLQKQAEDYIDGVDDPYIKKLLSLRYLDGKRWLDIVRETGWNATEDALRVMCSRYVDKH